MANTVLLDVAQAHPATNSGPPKWPKFPARNADLNAVRDYLTAVIDSLPVDRIDRAVRFGPNLGDPVAIWVRREGQQNKDICVRFERLGDIGKPATLRAVFAAALNGTARMRQPSVPQAGDFLAMVCRLAELLEEATAADEARDWVAEYLDRTRLVTGHSLADPEQRYDALAVLRSTPEFDRVQAGLYVRRELPREYWPAQLLDEVTDERWIRAGELAAYMRHVHGTQIAQPTLNARLREIGIDRVVCEVNRAELAHHKLVMYRLDPTPIGA